MKHGFRRTVVGTLAVIAVVLGWATAADAQSGRGSFDDRLANELGLTSSEHEKISAIKAQSAARHSEWRNQIHAIHKEIRDMMEASKPDEAAIMAKADEAAGLEAEVHKNHLRSTLETRALLSFEQRDQIAKIREEERDRRRKGRGLRECRDDARELCAGTDGGEAKLVCLAARWSELSSDCQELFER